jgi:hypothetical protein
MSSVGWARGVCGRGQRLHGSAGVSGACRAPAARNREKEGAGRWGSGA